MSSYIGVQVPDEPIGNEAGESWLVQGAHDQKHLHEHDQAPKMVATRSKGGDAPTPWGEREPAAMTTSTSGNLPSVTFEGSGMMPHTNQPNTTSSSPLPASSLSQQHRDIQEEDTRHAGETKQGGDQSTPLLPTAPRGENEGNSGDRVSKVEHKSTGKAIFAYFLIASRMQSTRLRASQLFLLGTVADEVAIVAPPPQTIVRPGPEPNRDTNHISFKSPFPPNTTLHPTSAATSERPQSRQAHSSLANIFQFNSQTNGSGTSAAGASDEGRMFFGASKLPGTIAHRRKSLANTNAITNYEADLTSRDRAKQKEAVKRLLADKIRDDWEWEWPQPEQDSSAFATPGLENNYENDRRPRLSLSRLRRSRDPSREPSPDLTADRPHRLSLNVLRRSRDPSREPSPDLTADRPRRLSLNLLRLSRDPSPEPVQLEWKQRDEWVSDYSDTEADQQDNRALEKSSSVSKASPFRFETPDGVGESIKKVQYDRKRRRKRRNKEEMEWNDGLRCFIERRDAWTGARHVRAPMKSPAITRRTSNSSGDGGSSTAIDNEEDYGWEDSDTEVPIAPPLLPPTNAMRLSITPEAYNTIYDKVVLQQLTPSCPMNLTDVVRSCVHGWKRDGEWPPTGTPMEPPKAKKKPRKLSVASIFGLDKGKDEKEKEPGSPIRRGLQRLMSMGNKDQDKSALQSPTTPGAPPTPKSASIDRSKGGAGAGVERVEADKPLT
jgi:hypothetical protein